MDVVAGGVAVDLHEDAEVVEECWDRCCNEDVGVGHADEGDHEEGCRAHDRWGDGSAGGCGRFDGCGGLFGEAGFDHGGDGHGPRGEYVGYGRSAHHAHRRGGGDGNFRGTPSVASEQRVSELCEKLCTACVLEGDAEQQEAYEY